MEDVEFTKDKVDLEIAKLRAHDSEISGTRSKFWSDKKALPSVKQGSFVGLLSRKAAFPIPFIRVHALPREKNFPLVWI